MGDTLLVVVRAPHHCLSLHLPVLGLLLFGGREWVVTGKDVVLEEFRVSSSSSASDGGAVEGKLEREEVGKTTITQYDHLMQQLILIVIIQHLLFHLSLLESYIGRAGSGFNPEATAHHPLLTHEDFIHFVFIFSG